MECLGPACDNLRYAKDDRLAACVAAVEHGVVDESAFVVDFHLVFGGRLGTFALADDLVEQSGFGFYHAGLFLFFLKESYSFALGVAILQFVDSLLDVAVSHHHVPIAVLYKTVDEALFDEFEVGGQCLDSDEAGSLLCFDLRADLLANLSQLRIVLTGLDDSVQLFDELVFAGSGGVTTEHVHGNLLAVEQTKSIVDGVAGVLEGNRSHFVGAFGLDGFEVAFLEVGRSLILSAEVLGSAVSGPLIELVVDGVNQALEEQFLVDSPCRVVGQTAFLHLFNGIADVLCYALNLGGLLLNFGLIAFDESVHEGGGSGFVLGRVDVTELLHLDAVRVNQTEGVVHRVIHVGQFDRFALVGVTAGNHCNCCNDNQKRKFFHCLLFIVFLLISLIGRMGPIGYSLIPSNSTVKTSAE